MDRFLDIFQLTHRVIIARSFQFYLKLVKLTSTFYTNNISSLIKEIEQGLSVVYAIWHCESVLHLLLPCRLKTYAFFTGHSAADLYARLVSDLGYTLLRPSGENGMQRQILMAKDILLTPGKVIGIAVDGPFGPSRVAKHGAAMLANLSGAPIIPFHCKARYTWTKKKTWDNRLYPCLFNEFIFLNGPPINIGPEATTKEIDDATLHLQSELNKLCKRA